MNCLSIITVETKSFLRLVFLLIEMRKKIFVKFGHGDFLVNIKCLWAQNLTVTFVLYVSKNKIGVIWDFDVA